MSHKAILFIAACCIGGSVIEMGGGPLVRSIALAGGIFTILATFHEILYQIGNGIANTIEAKSQKEEKPSA